MRGKQSHAVELPQGKRQAARLHQAEEGPGPQHLQAVVGVGRERWGIHGCVLEGSTVMNRQGGTVMNRQGVYTYTQHTHTEMVSLCCLHRQQQAQKHVLVIDDDDAPLATVSMACSGW